AVVTILPKQHGEALASVSQQALSLKVNGKPATITSWAPLSEANDSLELVILIDGSARSTLGNQLDDIAHFVNSLPPNAKAAIAYMQNGIAYFAGPLTANHVQVLQALHLPGGSPGSSASPYFCISDLAKRWPSTDRMARRVAVLVTDGVDNYNLRYDPQDPYVEAAVNDSVRAGLVVYMIYWQNQGLLSRTAYENNAGENLMLQVTDATGGKSFWEGFGNPVSFQPYFEELTRRLQNQYLVGFSVPLNGKPTAENLKLKVSGVVAEVVAPQQVFVSQAGAAQ
ncbi:MAG: hypothetical protein ABR906_09135, partial [Terracidiphilus sp.]